MTLALALGGCAEREAPSADAGADVRATLESLAALLLDGDGERPAAPSWPRDLRFHPEARAESVELLAVLHDADGTPFALRRRLERLSLRPAAARDAGRADGFAFDDVVRLDGEIAGVDRSGAPRARRREALERVALGLARASVDAIAVRDVSLVRAAGVSGGRCASTLTLEEGDGTRLGFVADRCPSARRVARVVTSDSATLAVAGTVGERSGPRAVEGVGWVRRAWGAPPPPGGALVLERVTLALAGLGQLDVERSRRASGRGPVTTVARVRDDEEEGIVRELELEWLDGAAATSGDATTNEATTADAGDGDTTSLWTLRASDGSVELRLEPLIGDGRALGDERRDDVAAGVPGRTRHLAVRATGSHTGVGFVELGPPTRTRTGTGTVTGREAS